MIFLTRKCFRADSMLGRAGPDGKSTRPATSPSPTRPARASRMTRWCMPTCPRIVKYYLGEEIIVPNVPTYICAEEKDLRYTLENLDKLVVKAANESGGYGMLVGPHSTQEQRAGVRREGKG